MIVFYRYYASILGLIRFLGIGVGNEHARASLIFTLSFFPLTVMILKLFGINTEEIKIVLNLVLSLGIFFTCYLFFSRERNIEIINLWLKKTALKEKLLTGLLSLLFFISVIIIFLKYYA